MLLKDKVVIIIGVVFVCGLGFVIVKLFVENGVKVVIIDFNGEVSKIVVVVLGEGYFGLVVNVVDEVQVQVVIEQILVKYGWVDVLVNNVGIIQLLKLMDIKCVNYDVVFDVSLCGMLLMLQVVIFIMWV